MNDRIYIKPYFGVPKGISHYLNAFIFVIILLPFIPSGCSDFKVRGKVEKDKASLRILAAALDAYCMNWSKYPDELDLLTKKIIYDPTNGTTNGDIIRWKQ